MKGACVCGSLQVLTSKATFREWGGHSRSSCTLGPSLPASVARECLAHAQGAVRPACKKSLKYQRSKVYDTAVGYEKKV